MTDILSLAACAGLIAPADLAAVLATSPGTLKLVDASYGASIMPGADPFTAFQRVRIGNAVYFDIDDVADPRDPLPHTVPTPEIFAAKVGGLGIAPDDFVVCYDQTGVSFAAARAWWLFRAFGHSRVCVLDGGLRSWVSQGLAVETGFPGPVTPVAYALPRGRSLTYTLPEMASLVDSGASVTIIDARGADRFYGLAPEPRAGMRAGHMPGAVNLPFQALIDPATGGLKPADAVNPFLTAADIKPGAPVVTTCGSGVTACVVTLALYRAGFQDAAVYDGSWAEWGQVELNTPVIKP